MSISSTSNITCAVIKMQSRGLARGHAERDLKPSGFHGEVPNERN